MTYCAAVLLDAGMVLASDSRTTAGVDHISTYRKMHVYAQQGERVIVVLTSGNLSLTQNTISQLEQAARTEEAAPTLWNVSSMFEAAQLVGSALRDVKKRDEPHLRAGNVSAFASFIVGGQIRGERQRLFNIYDPGNFIEATPETPFFQIGESKYGKPILDRVITPATPLVEATKCLVVSFDSTMRSNISVGPPIDVLVYENGAMRVKLQHRIDESDPYFKEIRRRWGEGLHSLFASLPDPDWGNSD